MTSFLWHSLFRAYGWRFLWHVALPHPARTAAALARLSRLRLAGDAAEVPGGGGAGGEAWQGPGTVVGAGFCLKPLECPSGRFNHDCARFDAAGQPAEACCRACAIRQLGEAALRGGGAFYIMTSARDILEHVYLPALRERRYAAGLFYLCRYSFAPFAFGLLAAGMRGRLVAFARGDCRDYRTWVRADVGIKEELAELPLAAIEGAADECRAAVRAEKRGGVYRLRAQTGQAGQNAQRSTFTWDEKNAAAEAHGSQLES